MSRKDLHGAPYNPRKIDTWARKKLEENLKRVGLLEPLVVNRTTGNLVGGHQRLAIMDALEGRDDYLLDISVVDLSREEEKAQVVFFNNPTAQGQFDIPELEKLIRDDGIDAALMGFDPMDITELMPDLAPELDLKNAPEDVQKEIEEAREIAEEVKETGADLRKKRDVYKERRRLDDDPNFYLNVICRDVEQKDEILRRIGLEAGARMVRGDDILAALPEVKDGTGSEPQAGRDEVAQDTAGRLGPEDPQRVDAGGGHS